MTGDVKVAGAILKEGETCATNIEIGWHDLWRQDDIQLAKAAVDCLINQVPCPVCGKVMKCKNYSVEAGMGFSILFELRCYECSLSIGLPDDIDLIGSPKALYKRLRRYLGKVAKPTGLRYPLCVTREHDGVRAWYGVRDPVTGNVCKPEEYAGEFRWEDDSEEWRMHDAGGDE